MIMMIIITVNYVLNYLFLLISSLLIALAFKVSILIAFDMMFTQLLCLLYQNCYSNTKPWDDQVVCAPTVRDPHVPRGGEV